MRFVNIIKQRHWFVLLFVFLATLILLSSHVRASTNNINLSLNFLDNSTLTIDAQGVPLATVLGDIQEKTNLQFKIHESLLEQPISVRFQSLPLNKAIGRILHGVSYACIFSLSGNIETVITFPSANEVREYSSYRNIPSMGPSYEATMEDEPPPDDEEIEDLMEIMPPPAPARLMRAMRARGTPALAELEDFLKAMRRTPAYEEESIDEPAGILFPSEEGQF
jgi:hypothetical protein